MQEKPIFMPGRMSPAGVERLRSVFAFLFRLLSRLEARGLENLPPGGLIICPNHLSRFDPPLIFVMVPNRKVTVFNADTYRTNYFFRWVVESVDVIWVKRGAIPPSTIKYAVRALKAGSVLGVAPEGTRSPTHALQEGKTGAVYLAYASGAPLVPAAITSTEKIGDALRHLRRIPVTVTFGEPIYFGKGDPHARPDARQLEADTTEVMCRIAAMLPPEYRGVYADHPRVRELLEAKGARAPVGQSLT
jgi:1-acyl-sn-glycerol-3-phosphate acyltransferase